MRIVKVSNKFYRVYNKRGICKDVFIEFGEIKEPRTQYDILTETEKQAVELEIEKNGMDKSRNKITGKK